MPATAVVRRGQITALFVADGDTARLRMVVLGRTFHEGVEVVSGLSEGERIVTTPPAGPGRWRADSHGSQVMASLGTAGRIAAAFIHSKLTPLVIVASTALGVMAVLGLAREEEPQIIVPMVDVFVDVPGATPAEVEQRVTRPVEKLLWEIPGVEYVYSTSSPGRSMVIVRFKVGEDQEHAMVRLNQKLHANADKIPPGAHGPLVKLRSIDDVPILGITLWSTRYDDHQLRLLAAQLHDSIKEVPDVSDVTIIGGRPRVASVEIDPARLEVYGLDPLMVRSAIQGNVRTGGAGPLVDGQSATLEAGMRLESIEQLRDVVVTSRAGRPVRLADVATVSDRDADPTTYVRHHVRGVGAAPAVTIAVAKRAGTNATAVAHRVQAKVKALQGTLVPSDVHVEITRDYGETAAEKSNELLYHMGIAVVSVSILIWIALGFREALVVLVAIPVTLALTLFMFYLYGYTLNRITLFALIFSIGILVDDAIVVVENIVRHARLQTGMDDGLTAVALRAVDEVGNPTILATLTVVAAILPMAFVGGLMGPYMRPIPVGASAAMVFSLIVAFVVTPWAAVRLLRPHGHHGEETGRHHDALVPARDGAAHRRLAPPDPVPGGRGRPAARGDGARAAQARDGQDAAVRQQERVPGHRRHAGGDVARADRARDGRAGRRHARGSGRAARAGLRRHRVAAQLQRPRAALLPAAGAPPGRPAGEPAAEARAVRAEPRHRQARPRSAACRSRRRFGATIQVAEVPPGPPVLQTLVAEIYGPDQARRTQLATQVRRIFERTPGVVDADWYVEDPQTKLSLVVDEEKAAAAGIAPATVAGLVRMAGSGESAGLLHDDASREDVPILIRLPREARQDLATFQSLRLGGPRAVSDRRADADSRRAPRTSACTTRTCCR